MKEGYRGKSSHTMPSIEDGCRPAAGLGSRSSGPHDMVAHSCFCVFCSLVVLKCRSLQIHLPRLCRFAVFKYRPSIIISRPKGQGGEGQPPQGPKKLHWPKEVGRSEDQRRGEADRDQQEERQKKGIKEEGGPVQGGGKARRRSAASHVGEIASRGQGRPAKKSKAWRGDPRARSNRTEKGRRVEGSGGRALRSLSRPTHTQL